MEVKLIDHKLVVPYNSDFIIKEWKSFLSGFVDYENVRIVCSDGVYTTHKLLLVHTHFLKYLILQGDIETESVILLPDFSLNQVKAALLPFKQGDTADHKANNKSQFDSTEEQNLFELLSHHKEQQTDFKNNDSVWSEAKDQNLKAEKDAIETKSFNSSDTSIKTNYEKRTRRKRKVGTNEMKDFIVDNDDVNVDDYFSAAESYDADDKDGKTKSAKKIKKCVKNKIKEESLINCDVCGAGFSNQQYLDSHITKKHPEKSGLTDFITKQKSGFFKCQLCEKEFSTTRKLRYHLKIKHKIGAKFECDVCKKRFYYDYELETHRKIHFGERIHKCDLCNKSFLENKLLIQHNINVHCSREEKEKNRKFVCSKCGKGFFSKGALQDHEFLHSDTKQFNCNTCGKLFRQASGLRAHCNRYHSVTGPKMNSEEQKERMRNYMKKYRAMKHRKIPDIVHHRYMTSSGEPDPDEKLKPPEDPLALQPLNRPAASREVIAESKTVFLTQEELVALNTDPQQHFLSQQQQQHSFEKLATSVVYHL